MSGRPSTRACHDCGTWTRGKRCFACYKAMKAKPDRFCEQCGKKLSKANQFGLCKTHSLQAAHRRARESPEFVERLRENGRIMAEKNFYSEEGRRKWLATRKDAGAKRTERFLGWCPLEWRGEYKRLLHRNRSNAQIARAEVERRIAAKKIARLAVTQSDPAAHFLRKFTAVMRTNEGWRYGTATLTPEQLIERAMQKGWEPERWAA